MTPVSRLSEIRMSTVVSLETLKFKAVMNKQRMNATELLLYLWLVLSVDTICSVRFIMVIELSGVQFGLKSYA